MLILPEDDQAESVRARRALRPARARRRRWPYVLAAGLLALCAAVVALGLAATCRPAWYNPPVVDSTQLHADKVQLARVEEDVSTALNRRREVRVQLTEAQVNRWLAALDRLWQEPLLERYGVQQPQVTFLDGALRLAAKVQRGGLGAVVSATGRPEPNADELVIRYQAGSVGALPVAAGWVERVIARLPASLGIRTSEPGVVRVPRSWTWPNGKCPCRIRELILSAGSVEVVLEPRDGEPR